LIGETDEKLKGASPGGRAALASQRSRSVTLLLRFAGKTAGRKAKFRPALC
jgi:hypothetical protein